MKSGQGLQRSGYVLRLDRMKNQLKGKLDAVRTAAAKDLLRILRKREKEMTEMLGKFVRCESPSHNKAAVDRFGGMVAQEWKRRGGNVRVLRQREFGDHLRAEIWFGERRPARQILILGHLDTVYPMGTHAATPFRVSDGHAWGPGTFDMKGGLTIALFAVDALKAAGLEPSKRFVFFWNSDEETGSKTSRPHIEREARRSDAVLVLEPGAGRDGRVKTARKGAGSAEIVVTG
jgi:glutamate carboxypeptidase